MSVFATVYGTHLAFFKKYENINFGARADLFIEIDTFDIFYVTDSSARISIPITFSIKF